MSILLSLYTKDGIVFASDRNMTWDAVVFEGHLTKVFLWPNRKAVIGFVGLAFGLEDLQMDEWLRIFIAETREVQSLKDIADILVQRLQNAYSKLPARRPKPPLIIHLGGFDLVHDVLTPMLYVVTNVPGLDRGRYLPSRSKFKWTEEVHPNFEGWPSPSRYPEEVRQRFTEMEKRDHFLWFNNGDRYPAFNVFKGALYGAFKTVREAYGSGVGSPWTLFDWQAYAKMAVELHALYYKHTLPPQQRLVGGGVDMCSIAWPD